MLLKWLLMFLTESQVLRPLQLFGDNGMCIVKGLSA